MPSVLLVIAPHNFRDEELFDTSKALQDNNIKTTITSTIKTEITGKLGGKVIPDLTLTEVNIINYDAIAIIGGSGAPELANYPEFFDLVKEFKAQGKLICAICIAPILLAQAGLLKNKQATVWNGDGLQNMVLEGNGASFIDQAVVIDGDTITGNGPQAATEFGQTIARQLLSVM